MPPPFVSWIFKSISDKIAVEYSSEPLAAVGFIDTCYTQNEVQRWTIPFFILFDILF